MAASVWMAGWLAREPDVRVQAWMYLGIQFVTADEQEEQQKQKAAAGEKKKGQEIGENKEENTGNSACVSKTCKRGWSFGRSRASRGEACYQDNWCYPATGDGDGVRVHSHLCLLFTGEGTLILAFGSGSGSVRRESTDCNRLLNQ
ncbi:hypothetical protein MGYG_08766 [Nannizzia gypsea CBS 118893]|uniref:Uncharacterized protein n=1 Tax=Arthroderma gypseum (strain ATCC MYA-4604 / CBS 118893) TaxID=535722 RepID=E4V6X9_ARTGP|nr:hypothetical protein MGYG_08766 [Nannizzia gypsea CBS 118893]EFQ96845.1 hypothetical protein MGYG_08766 [Nannizzia gypsea CBS 118893]